MYGAGKRSSPVSADLGTSLTSSFLHPIFSAPSWSSSAATCWADEQTRLTCLFTGNYIQLSRLMFFFFNSCRQCASFLFLRAKQTALPFLFSLPTMPSTTPPLTWTRCWKRVYLDSLPDRTHFIQAKRRHGEPGRRKGFTEHRDARRLARMLLKPGTKTTYQ